MDERLDTEAQGVRARPMLVGAVSGYEVSGKPTTCKSAWHLGLATFRGRGGEFDCSVGLTTWPVGEPQVSPLSCSTAGKRTSTSKPRPSLALRASTRPPSARTSSPTR